MLATLPLPVRRWCSVLLYALLGALLAGPTAKFIGGLLKLVPSPQPGWPSSLFGLLGAALLLYYLVRWFRPRWKHFTLFNCRRCPSALLAVPLGFALHILVPDLMPAELPYSARGSLALWSPLLALLAVLGVYLAHQKKEARPKDPVAPDEPQVGQPTTQELPKTAAEFDVWLGRNTPVDNARDGWFGLRDRALAILSVLQETRDGNDPRRMLKSVAVLGHYGVGKTSALQVAETEAPKHFKRHILFAWCSCWGFDSSAKAQEMVLEACVDRLAQEIDCTDLRGLPATYLSRFEFGDGAAKILSSWLADLLGRSATLEKLAPYLRAIDADLVVVLEDLDRASEDFDRSRMYAMLHELRDIEGVTFAIALGSSTADDLTKVVHHIEFIEPFSPREVNEVVSAFRNMVLQDPDYLDAEALRKNYRGKSGSLRYEIETPASVLFGPSKRGLSSLDVLRDEGLGILLGPARTLKAALSDFRATWRQLRGEVDPDDLLILSTLRRSAFPVYQWVVFHADDLRKLGETWANQSSVADEAEKKTTRDTLRQSWEKAAPTGAAAREAVISLICALLPCFKIIVGEPHGKTVLRALSVAGPRGSTYLARVAAGRVRSDECSDRNTLALIQRLAREGVSACDGILKALGRQRAPTELFVALANELRAFDEPLKDAFASCVVQDLRTLLGEKASLQDEAFFEAFRPWIPRRQDSATAGWYYREIDLALRSSIYLAGELLSLALDTPRPIDDEFTVKLAGVLNSHWESLTPDEWVAKFPPEDTSTVVQVLSTLVGFCANRGGLTFLAWVPERIIYGMRLRSDFAQAVAHIVAPSQNNGRALILPLLRFFGPLELEALQLLAHEDGVRDLANARLKQLSSTAAPDEGKTNAPTSTNASP